MTAVSHLAPSLMSHMLMLVRATNVSTPRIYTLGMSKIGRTLLHRNIDTRMMSSYISRNRLVYMPIRYIKRIIGWVHVMLIYIKHHQLL